jgi:hypothetical protein
VRKELLLLSERLLMVGEGRRKEQGRGALKTSARRRQNFFVKRAGANSLSRISVSEFCVIRK